MTDAVRAKREAAANARRVAHGISVKADRDRVMAFADQLDAEADTFERETAGSQMSRLNDRPAA